MPVTEITHDCERGAVLLGGLFAMAFTSKLRTELVVSKRLAVPVDFDSFRGANLRDGTGSLRSDACQALHVLLKTQIAEPRSQGPGSLLDRRENYA